VEIIESIKTIERVDKVTWAEEVRLIPTEEMTILNFQESVNTNVDVHRDTNGSSPAERMPP